MTKLSTNIAAIETKLSAIDVAQLSAVIEGGGYKRSATKAKAIEKFAGLLAGIGYEAELMGVLAMDFDGARNRVMQLKSGKATEPKAEEPAAPAEPKPEPNAPVKPKRKTNNNNGAKSRYKGMKISIIGGKDAANPFRAGSLSHAAFEFVQKNPGTKLEDLRAAGVRMRTVTEMLRDGPNGWNGIARASK